MRKVMHTNFTVKDFGTGFCCCFNDKGFVLGSEGVALLVIIEVSRGISSTTIGKPSNLSSS